MLSDLLAFLLHYAYWWLSDDNISLYHRWEHLNLSNRVGLSLFNNKKYIHKMKTLAYTTKKLLVPSLIVLMFCGCTSKTAKQTIEEYNRVLEQVQTLERLVSTADFSVFSGEEIAELYSTASELYYDYNPKDLKEEQRVACEELKARVAKLRSEERRVG